MSTASRTTSPLHFIALMLTFVLTPFGGCATGTTTVDKQLAAASDRATAEWTLMVFLNGDNNLESFALKDFLEMAKVGSDDNVNVVVQFDRSGKYDQSVVQWTQTLRFHVKKDMEGVQQEALADLGETNMGDGKTLQAFVEWSIERFPAKRYGLVIWDHGEGWRDIAAAGTQSRESAALRAFRAASHDESSDDQLYNAEMVTALSRALKGKKLALLGFDACLMAMLETGYAFRQVADVLVGSEELEPGDGWNYEQFLKKLTDKPQMNAEQLATEIVEAYRDYYGSGALADPDTTQSAMRLEKIDGVAAAVDALARSLEKHLQTEQPIIQGARNACREYGSNGGLPLNHIDVGKFSDELLARTAARATSAQRELAERATAVRNEVLSSIFSNYAGKARQGSFGSNGMAIYFPASGTMYKNDLRAENGYEKSNKKYPVEFVQKNGWTDFLHAYFRMIP